MVMHEWAIKKIGHNEAHGHGPGGDSFQSYLNITPIHGFMAQKGLNIEIGTGLMHEYDYSDDDSHAYHGEARRIFGVLGVINIFPISYL